MSSLCIRSRYDVKVEVSSQTYQVGAHFKALNKAVLVLLLKTLEKFFSISSVAEAQWHVNDVSLFRPTFQGDDRATGGRTYLSRPFKKIGDASGQTRNEAKTAFQQEI